MVRGTNPTRRGASYPLLGIGVLHVAAGIFVYVASARREDQFADLAAEMGLTLGFDIFAARRAHTYRDQLAAVVVETAVDQSGAPVALITQTFTF